MRIALLLSLLALLAAACSPAGAALREERGERTCRMVDEDRDGVDACDDGCPEEAEDEDAYEDEDGCPDLDNDHDGIPDAHDRCPCVAEDEDDFEDEDGCPDPDNDRDHIPDACDACPNEPETWNGQEDGDGCPDRGLVLIRVQRIVIVERVYFRHNAAEIQEPSQPLLEEIAHVLRDYPMITRVEVSGHTDDTERRPERLGMRRAEAVVEALVALGVERERLVLRSWGAEHPIASNHAPEGRALNRRVEYRILERAEDEANAPAPGEVAPSDPGAPPAGPIPMDHCAEGPPPPPIDVCEEARRRRALSPSRAGSPRG